MIAVSIRRLARSDYMSSVFQVSLSTALRSGSHGQLPKCSGLGRRSFASVTGSLESSLAPEKDELGVVKDSLKTRSQNYHCSVYTSSPNTFVCTFLLPIVPLRGRTESTLLTKAEPRRIQISSYTPARHTARDSPSCTVGDAVTDKPTP